MADQYLIRRTATEIAAMPIGQARRRLNEIIDQARAFTAGERVMALDFNARLVTELRERQVPIWDERA